MTNGLTAALKTLTDYDTANDNNLSTKAPLLNPTFTNNILVNGNIGVGTSNPTSSIQACGTLNFAITEQGVQMGTNGAYAGVAIVADPAGSAFKNITHTSSGAYNNVCVINCEIATPMMNFQMNGNWLEAYLYRVCLMKKAQIGSNVDSKIAMLDATGTFHATGDTTIGGTITAIGDFTAPNIVTMNMPLLTTANADDVCMKTETDKQFAALVNAAPAALDTLK